ncbi:MAG TPA: hypothetical protein VEG38_21570 [Acidimicrobiia bacterium]|nr:hypothetical protein [Acidimicrobiia bacterium]
MGTANSGPSEGLNGLAAQYGVTPTLSGGAYADPQDLPVLVGRSQRAPGKGEFTMQEESQFLYGGMPSDYTREFPTEKRISELERDFWSKDRDAEISELQRRLWAGGFYPPGADPTEIALGDRDPYTEKAWQNALDRAAKFRAAGQNLTLDEVIDMGANIRKEGGINGEGGPGGTGRAPLVTELANPEDLKYYAQKTAVNTLGRALRPDELERFVSSFHASQQQSQAAAYNAGGTGGPGGSVVGAPSAAVAAEQFARQADPTAAGAHDQVRVFDVVSRVLGGRRRSG